MQTVSSAYKSCMKAPLRNRSFISVNFGIFNDTLRSQAAFSHPADTYIWYSNDSRVFSDGSEDFVYATLENNFFKVDGSQKFLPPEGYSYALENSGVVSQEIVDDGNVVFTINFPQTTWYGLTLDFGENYPTEFDIIFGGTTVQVRNNDSSVYVADRAFTNVSQIKIKFWTMATTGVRARLYNVKFGIGYEFGNDDIMDSSLTRSVSPISEFIPQYDFWVQLKNFDRYFDVDNPDSAINFLQANNRVSVQYGLELNDGTIEWVMGQKLICNEWESDDKTATIRCVDVLRGLNMEFPGTVYYEGGVSYGEMAEILLEDGAGLDSTDYVIPDEMYDYTTTLPIPRGTVKELLQIIANASQMTLMLDREGRIVFKDLLVPPTPTFRLDKTDMLSYPKAKKQDPVKDFVVEYQRWQKNGTERNVLTEEITVASGEYKTYYFTDPNYAWRVTVDGNSYSIANFGDYFITLYFGTAGTKTVDIYAKPYTVVKQQYKYSDSTVTEGRTLTWSNPLVDFENKAILLGLWLSNYYNSDIEYNYESRGNPELDPCDVIYQDNDYAAFMRVMVTEMVLNFKQSFRGQMTTRKMGGS